MAKVCVRRYSDPEFVRAIKEAIGKITHQKQCPNEDRIVRILQGEYEWGKGEILKQLKLAVKDGFLNQVTTTSNHGSTKGIPQTAFRLNQENGTEPIKDTHDWYCWRCHRPGEVILCDFCPRVFHKRCARDGAMSASKWRCPSCQPENVPELMASKSTDELSKMLKFTLERMKEKAKDFLQPFCLEKYDDYLQFVIKPVDLSLLEKNVRKKHYKTAKQFREHAQWILHNAIIYFGEDRELTELAEAIMEDCDGELEEMVRCPDCYIQSNVRSANWFCKPCFFPHELVWAKMTGEPPWPAKLLTWSDDQTRALVRFFGSAHQRAWVGSKNVKPIACKPEVKKRSQRWLQAIDEMKEYQKQLRKLYPDSSRDKEISSNKKNALFIDTETQTDAMASISNGENVKNKETEQIANNKEMVTRIGEMETNHSKAVQNLEAKLGQVKQHNECLSTRYTQQNSELRAQIKLLEEHLKSATNALKNEMTRCKELEKDLCQREQECAALKCELTQQTTGQNGTQNNKRSYEAIVKDQTGTIMHLQAALEKERQEKQKVLLDSLSPDSQKSREREIQQAVKRAVNKERLEKERAIDDAVKRAAEKYRQDRDRHLQQALQMAKDEAQKSLQEAVALAKRKQWCSYCNNEAFYPCCWNTSYCTVECQKAHWCSHRFHCMRLACNCGKNC